MVIYDTAEWKGCKVVCQLVVGVLCFSGCPENWMSLIMDVDG